MVGYEKYPYFFINFFSVWILLNQSIHDILLMNASDKCFEIYMDGLLVFRKMLSIQAKCCKYLGVKLKKNHVKSEDYMYSIDY